MNDSTQTIPVSPTPDAEEKIAVQVKNLDLYYDRDVQALDDINLDIPDRKVTAFIGPLLFGAATVGAIVLVIVNVS